MFRRNNKCSLMGNPIEIKKVIEKIRKKINSGYPEFGKNYCFKKR